jgi:hypothetical protein
VTPELIFGIAVVLVLVLAIVGKLLPKRQPPSPLFKCARCGTTARHNNRTAEAWRSGKARLFCQACHAQWLASQTHGLPSSSRNPGCLSIVVMFATLPLGFLALLWAYT